MRKKRVLFVEEVVNLESSKKIKLEQLNRKFIAWDNCLRIAEELKANTEYGEKVILFGVSQSHAVQLVKAINQVFKTSEDELSPRYAEAIISENDELNATPEIVEIKEKVKAGENYEPSEQEIDEIKVWSKNPNVYLD